MTEDNRIKKNSSASIYRSTLGETAIHFNESLSSDYAELSVNSLAHIIFPKNLPIKITISGVRTIVHVGEFAIIPPNCVFAINSSPERYCIDFNFDLIKNNPNFTVLLPKIVNPCIFHPVNTEKGPESGYTSWFINTQNRASYENHNFEFLVSPVSIIKEIVNTLISNQYHFTNAYCSAKIAELYSLLGEEVTFIGFNGKHETVAASGIINNLSSSIHYICSNYNLELTLEDVANSAGYSRSHYSKLFKEFYGISFYDYLLSVRVRSAALLLSTTETPISEVGMASGFTSSSTLNRVFKQETGFSPREYRKLFGNNN